MAYSRDTQSLLAFFMPPSGAQAAGPSFDGGKVPTGVIEEIICQDDVLVSLDQTMAEIYTTAAIASIPPFSRQSNEAGLKDVAIAGKARSRANVWQKVTR